MMSEEMEATVNEVAMESDDRCRALFEGALDLMFELSLDGKFLAANQPCLEALGYDTADIARLWIYDLLDVKDLERALTAISEITTAGRAGQLNEFVLRRKDGKLVVVETTGVLLKKEGKPSFIMGIARDITARRDLEAQLRAAERMCAVGQLASETAHDFNNQLNIILGNAELIGERVTDDPILARQVENIFTAITRAGNLTARLLALALRGETLSIPVDVHDVIEEVISILRSSMADGIRVSSDLNANSPVAQADPATLQNALLSLAFNACDAMPDGGELRFSTNVMTLSNGDLRGRLSEIRPGSYLRIDVTDTGVGMDETTMTRIFEPSFTTKSSDLYAGMGLETVSRGLTPHRAVVDVASELGSGTTFSVYLPLDEPGAWAGHQPQSSAEVVPGRGRIFLIDDDEMICDITSAQLGKLGYGVDVFHHCEQALDTYRHIWREVQLIILDISMPVMSGTEVFRAMRAVNPDARILLMSGFSHDPQIDGLIAGGHADFIEKPFRKAMLSKKVAMLLSG